MSRLRFALRLAGFAALLALCLPLHGVWRLVRCPSPWPRRFLAGVARITGAKARVVGAPLRDRVVFLANHQSWLDIPLIAGAAGCAFVAKAELDTVPVIGWLCRLNRTVFVDRTRRAELPAQLAAIRDALGEAGRVAIFPEGTTGDGTALLPFKPALLQMLDPPPPGVQVQPVLVDYAAARADVAWVGDEPGAHHARRLLGRRGGFTATVMFLDPFDPADVPGRKAIAGEARRRMEAAQSH